MQVGIFRLALSVLITRLRVAAPLTHLGLFEGGQVLGGHWTGPEMRAGAANCVQRQSVAQVRNTLEMGETQVNSRSDVLFISTTYCV